MRDLLFVAHAVGFTSLATGLRAWLHRNRASLAGAPPPRDEARYQTLIRELADLERRNVSNEVSPVDYEARRDQLMKEAARLRGR
ncbi:MAG: hypothetical protein IPK07_11090 [Deltaproteobacteria bacterium]|jgi:hypothetical protein|nr:hypothetical protein [Deltaproteobacteria bacterium]